MMPVSGNANDNSHVDTVNYRLKYRNLKRKFRYLIYENECFQEELSRAQRKLLTVNQDKSFLLDQLLRYEKLEDSSSDSDGTISSDSELDTIAIKKKKVTPGASHFSTSMAHSSMSRSGSFEAAPKRKKPTASKAPKAATLTTNQPLLDDTSLPPSQGDGHMTSEEIERHLESRQILMDLLPERAPPTVPTEMFSNDPSSLESEPNDGTIDTSPSNLGDTFGEEDNLIIDLPDQQGCM